MRKLIFLSIPFIAILISICSFFEIRFKNERNKDNIVEEGYWKVYKTNPEKVAKVLDEFISIYLSNIHFPQDRFYDDSEIWIGGYYNSTRAEIHVLVTKDLRSEFIKVKATKNEIHYLSFSGCDCEFKVDTTKRQIYELNMDSSFITYSGISLDKVAPIPRRLYRKIKKNQIPENVLRKSLSYLN